jgi:hypothetical protein
LHAAELGEASEDLPTLAHILARYREHGTLARSVAVWDPAHSQNLPGAASVPAVPAPARAPMSRPVPATAMPAARAATAAVVTPRPFAEVIEGLQTRELDGKELFEQFFGPTPPASSSPPAPR